MRAKGLILTPSAKLEFVMAIPVVSLWIMVGTRKSIDA